MSQGVWVPKQIPYTAAVRTLPDHVDQLMAASDWPDLVQGGVIPSRS